MRLDLFLKLSRLSPRRTIAQQLCDAGLVLLNDHPAKSAHAVKPNDLIRIRRSNHETMFRVLCVPASRNVSRSQSSQLTEVVKEKDLAEGSE